MHLRTILTCSAAGLIVVSTPAEPTHASGVSTSSASALQLIPRPPRPSDLRDLVTRGEAETDPRENPRSPQSNRELASEYRKETGMLAYPINTNWSSEADNARIEQAVAEYRERVDRVAGGKFASLSPDQRESGDSTLRAHYDTLANTADREIAWAVQKLGQIGVADAAYNEMLVLDAALYGATTLYPDVPAYQEAKRKSAEALARFGSREGANDQKEEFALAEARKVQMPRAIDTSPSAVSQFRQAWTTSGIPYTIRRIHITSGWGTKRNALGQVIGRTRDAAIAAQDPETGRCNLYDFTMIIEPGGSPRRSSHAAKRIACENIP